METNSNQLLTQKQVAEMLQVSTGTLENWRINGQGPKYLKLGGQHRSPVRYRMQDVEDWMFEDSKGGNK